MIQTGLLGVGCNKLGVNSGLEKAGLTNEHFERPYKRVLERNKSGFG
jgi:hypothetical protein